MNTNLLDVAGPGLVVVFGLGALVVVLPAIILVEAIVLRLLKWGTLWKALLDAFLMNLASSVAGACVFSLGFLALTSAALWTSLLVSGVLSVLIEGGVLTLLKRHPARQTWTAALAANLVSYAGLAVLLALTQQ
jgi:hypothetical protein